MAQRNTMTSKKYSLTVNTSRPRRDAAASLDVMIRLSAVFPFPNTIAYLKQIRELCRQQHSDLVVVVMPAEMQVNRDLQKKIIEQVKPSISARNGTLCCRTVFFL